MFKLNGLIGKLHFENLASIFTVFVIQVKKFSFYKQCYFKIVVTKQNTIIKEKKCSTFFSFLKELIRKAILLIMSISTTYLCNIKLDEYFLLQLSMNRILESKQTQNFSSLDREPQCSVLANMSKILLSINKKFVATLPSY